MRSWLLLAFKGENMPYEKAIEYLNNEIYNLKNSELIILNQNNNLYSLEFPIIEGENEQPHQYNLFVAVLNLGGETSIIINVFKECLYVETLTFKPFINLAFELQQHFMRNGLFLSL